MGRYAYMIEFKGKVPKIELNDGDVYGDYTKHYYCQECLDILTGDI